MLSKPSSIKKGGYACQWLGNVDMHMYAEFDQNIPCGSRVLSAMDGRTNTVIRMHTEVLCNYLSMKRYVSCVISVVVTTEDPPNRRHACHSIIIINSLRLLDQIHLRTPTSIRLRMRRAHLP